MAKDPKAIRAKFDSQEWQGEEEVPREVRQIWMEGYQTLDCKTKDHSRKGSKSYLEFLFKKNVLQCHISPHG